MDRIMESRFVSRSLAQSAAVITYQEGLFVCKGRKVFPVTPVVAKTLCHYFECMGADFIRGFDVLRGLVDTPYEVRKKWNVSSALCHFCLVPLEDYDWMLIYSSLDESAEHRPVVMTMDQELLDFVLEEAGSFMICSEDRTVDKQRLWNLQKQMPDSEAVLCATTSGLDLLMGDDRAFSTSGSDVFYWMTFIAFCSEMLEFRQPGSMRFGVPFGKAGSFDLDLGPDGMEVTLHQNYQGGPETVGTILMTLDGVDTIRHAISEFRVGSKSVSMDITDEDITFVGDDENEDEEGAAS